ncbi:MFS transporter [Actinomadura darangshiensis]|uniref:MFS transporter n=1 Tax=Actinomadura darangshiensis TaxID=705336 RepID=A0A4R5B7F5_9ACTN|nr:MFS transporter [Actinomadura darangshiensis]TDD81851.1 MFS transporter [Actinomadura darangshiensis]
MEIRAEGTRAGWWPLAAIVLAVFMLMLDATITTVALPGIGRDLGADLDDLQWVLNGYTLAMAAFQLTAGSLADRLGRRRVFVAGVAVFAAASLACGLATRPDVLIGARVIQGLAGASMFATTLALIAQSYAGRDRGIAFGVRGTAAGVAVVLGPLAGGALVSGPGWRWIFLVNLPVAAVALAIAWRVLPRGEHLDRGRRLDVPGPVILAVTLFLLVLALLRGGGYGWGSARTVLLFAGAACGLAVFVLVQHVRDDPMLELSLFRRPAFTGTQIGSFTVQASVFALLVYLSFHFQNQLGYSAMRAGLAFLPLVVPILLTGPVAGAVMDRLPRGRLVAGALAALAAGIALMHGGGWWHLAPGMIVAGLACGVVLPVLGGLAVDVPDQRRLGMASGVNNTVLQIGFTVGVAGYGAALGTSGLDSLFVIGTVTALLGAVLTALLIRDRPGAL